MSNDKKTCSEYGKARERAINILVEAALNPDSPWEQKTTKPRDLQAGARARNAQSYLAMLEEEKAVRDRDEAERQARNAMSWDKCRHCDFLINTSGWNIVQYLCGITGNKMVLTDCVSPIR